MESNLCGHLTARGDARSVPVLIVFMVIVLLSGPILVKGQGTVYLFGDNITLPCVSATLSEDEFFSWVDQIETITIYAVNGHDVREQTDPAMNNDKYVNFDIDNHYPNNVSLLINLLEVNDAGMYACNLIGQAGTGTLAVDVEAMPISVSISCARSSSTECASPSSPTSDTFICNCIAIGAYPNSLQFDWSSDASGIQQSLSNSTERNETFDYETNAEIVLTENPGSVTCTLNGYSENWEGVRNATYMFNPPVCELQTTCIKTGNAVSLTCTCTDASPAKGLVYSFYRDGLLLPSGDTNVFEADIEVDKEYIFSCRGCNGLNYGTASNSSKPVMCQRNPFPIWVIILIIVVVLAVVIAVIAVIMYKKGKCGSNSSSDKLDDNGAGPRGDPEIPAYGVVDKNRTKDPTPAPRSSMRDSKNPSNPKQDGPMEMQYADLDHGNKPPSDEVRKPKEEPTEYATVQSVIV